MNPSRRLLPYLVLLSIFLPVTASAAGGERGAVTGSLALEMNGSTVGFIRSADGGGVRAEVISNTAGGNYVKKQLGRPEIVPLTLQLGPDMEKPVYDWITATWKGSSSRTEGALLSVSYDSNVLMRREFSLATIVETTIPSLDGSSKDAGYLTVKILPENIRVTKGGGTVSPTLGGRTRPWLASNFRVEIPGLDCSRVKKVDGFTVRSYPNKGLEIPTIKITLLESSADSWIAWHKSFVVDGQNGDSSEKDGAIIFLAADMGTEIGRISLSHLGISSLTFDKPEGASNMIRTVSAELYCEGMAFQWTGGSGGNVLNTRTLIR